MNKAPTPFLIVFTQDVTFKDRMDNVIREFKVGDITDATADNGTYFVTSMGGVYKEEARVVNGLELITYRHMNGEDNIRFRQYAKDAAPPWARDFRIDTEEVK